MVNLTVRGHKAWWGLLAICVVLSAPAFSANPPNFSVLFAFDLHNTAAGVVEGTNGPAGNNVGVLYGTTSDTSLTSGGTIYKVSKGGGAPEIVYQLKETDGYSPQATLLVGRNGPLPTDAADGYLYGTTIFAPRLGLTTGYGSGTVFKVRQDGTGFTTLYTFDASAVINSVTNAGVNLNGMHPNAALIQDAVYLYGVTPQGGAGSVGTVFRINKTDGSFTRLHTFPQPDATGINSNGEGAIPSAPLTLGKDGLLYGVTSGGGANLYTISTTTSAGTGTIYSLNRGGAVDAPLVSSYNFDLLNNNTDSTTPGLNVSGAQPTGGLVETDVPGVFVGTARVGGTPALIAPATTTVGYGTLFKYTAATNSVTPLYNFDNVTGAVPTGDLVFDNQQRVIYGVTSSGSPYANLYSFDLDTSAFLGLHAISEVGSLTGGLIMASDGDLYGTGASGSACTAINGVGYGAVFRYSLATGESSAGYSSCTPVSNSGGGSMSPGFMWLLALLGLAPPVRRRVFSFR